MLALIRFEIRKLAIQKKSWVGLLTIVLINFLFGLAFFMLKRNKAETPSHADPNHLVREFMNAYVYTQSILAPCVFMLFPMVLAIMAAHNLGGEFEVGSIRMMLFRPVSRVQVLLAKFVALSLYAAGMLLVLGLLSYGVSASFLPARGDLIVPGGMFLLPGEYRVLVHPAAEAPVRILLTYALAWPMLMSVCAMALMFALATRHFTSSAIVTTTVYFCSYIVGGIPLLSAIHPYLPTRYWPFFRYGLVGTLETIPWSRIAEHAGWTAAYTAAFLVIGAALFNLRDV
jgi:ABC-2 type transport system permease protein